MGRWLHLKKSTVLCWVVMVGVANGIGVNWGTQTSHLLPPSTVVQMLKNDGFQQVKLFDAEEGSMNALRRSGIEVMVGIPNDMLEMLATSTRAAQKWVSQNVSDYLNDEVNIRYVAVGNEPFLTTFNGSYIGITLPAIQNIQRALADADLSNRVKVTVPLNADVYQSASDRPSDGDFRPDIHDLMLNITRFLNDNGAPFIVNIYPFISLYNNPNFPVDFAFFDGTSSPVVDGTITYTNMFDANYDTLIWALRKSGFGNLPVIVGEIGWPTDGDINANLQLAQKFNQGIMARIASGKGTPLRPGPINAYIFSLIDEDQKSVMPGNFERHWGIYTFDGLPKYQLNLGKTNNSLVRAKNVRYLEKKWCVFNPSASLDDANVAPSVSYACANADCTSLGFRTSCGNLDARGNISYAFNSYYQMNDQINEACGFDNLAVITNMDPSTSTCRFQIMIQTDSGSFPRIRSFFFLWCFFFAHLLHHHGWF